jgi:SAM-dependent methyltransferase
MDPRYVSLLVELLSKQVPQAPGSPSSTRRALAAVGALPSSPSVADLGCGRGASALVLAEAFGSRVLAVDLSPEMVASTRLRAASAGLDVEAVVGDMTRPPVAPGSLDLLWSEGAAYSVGFAKALRAWRPLVRQGGCIGVSELCWRTDTVPSDAAAYWARGYPDMADADACGALLSSAGFDEVCRFFLPDSDWSAYYEPIAAALPAFREAHAGDAVAAAVADELQAEVEAWRGWGHLYGYVFLVGRAG